jgi:dipeptidyl aminopeptidase/acylaminoacyl peptidase
MDADGDNQVNRSNDPGDDYSPSWSPDGSKIAFVRGGIRLMNTNGGSQTLVVTPPSSPGRPAWKPDGSRLVFHRYGSSSVWAVDIDGSDLVALFAGVLPDYSPDGTRIVFVRDGEVRVADEDGGDQLALTESDGNDTFPDWLSGPPPPPPTSTPQPQPTSTPNPQATNTPAPQATNTPAPGGLLGDVNCSGAVDAIDAALLLQQGAGLLQDLPCPENADVNEDGQVNSIDAALILQYSAGLIDHLPP